ncbi:MAG: monovalent cation/H(+) antiporter subunit G [Verrucomicrobiae bacterium]|nr:monovalent cation/H(+) antiporter subunit G [Verrucomicrobiae bacterium]NNJ86008.1 monovalent cation/H(+) antiporter subunit G [Akkermansiaceae bacterium]
MISNLLLLLGSIAFLIASLGLFRLPDSYARLHAGTKASSFGVLLMVIAAALEFYDLSSLLLLAGTLVLTFLTAPLACHAIATRVTAIKKQKVSNAETVESDDSPQH